MIRIALSLFATGIILGAGPCLATCGPILISYIAATKKGPLGAVWSCFIFSMSRAFTYAALGALAGIIGANLYQSYYWQTQGFIIWFIGGIFICSLGILTIIGRNTSSKICQILQNIFIRKDTKSTVGLGILVGLFPCAPLIGILSYISMISIQPYQAAILALSFGVGTIISPLLILSVATGLIPKLKILQDERVYGWFQRIAGTILFLLGLHILIRTIMSCINR